jgi:hypothetical protein
MSYCSYQYSIQISTIQPAIGQYVLFRIVGRVGKDPRIEFDLLVSFTPPTVELEHDVLGVLLAVVPEIQKLSGLVAVHPRRLADFLSIRKIRWGDELVVPWNDFLPRHRLFRFSTAIL